MDCILILIYMLGSKTDTSNERNKQPQLVLIIADIPECILAVFKTANGQNKQPERFLVVTEIPARVLAALKIANWQNK